MIDQELISVTDIAEIEGKRRQSLHKLVRRLGLNVVKKKSDKGRGQLINHISASDYEELKRHINHWANPKADPTVEGSGVFYIIQLDPRLDPRRVKVGFTENLDERLRSHRTTAPYSQIVQKWPCKLLWEKTVIESITQDCERLYTEVFRADSINQLVKMANRFFELMPEESTTDDQDDEVV